MATENEYNLLFPQDYLETHIDKNPFTNLRNVTKKALEDAIISLKFLPGEKINMAKVASAIGVSRSTVNDALNLLADEGMVIRRPDINGFYVCDLSSTYLENFFQARTVLEATAAGLCAKRAYALNFDEFKKVMDDISRCYKEKNFLEFTRKDQELHKLIIDGSANSFIIEMYQSTMERTRALYASLLYSSYKGTDMSESGFYQILVFQHQTVIKAIKSGVPEVAEQAMRMHIDSSFQKFCRAYRDPSVPNAKNGKNN